MINTNQLKQLVRVTARIRENSYNHKEANKNKHDEYTDFSKYYTVNIKEAALMACNELNISTEFVDPVYLLLINAWNDILDWADINKEK